MKTFYFVNPLFPRIIYRRRARTLKEARHWLRWFTNRTPGFMVAKIYG